MKGLIYGIIYILVVVYIFAFVIGKVNPDLSQDGSGKETVYLSKDAGQNWSLIETKERELMPISKNMIFGSEHPSSLYLASTKGIFQIGEEKEESQKEGELNNYSILRFIQNPYDKNILYLIVNDSGNQKILISYNQGQSFKEVFILEKNDKISVFEIDPILPSRLYLGTKNGLFLASENSGENWEQKHNFAPQVISAIGVRETDGILFVSIGKTPFDLSFLINPPTTTPKPEIFFSKDGGVTFLTLDEGFDTSQINQNIPLKEIETDFKGKIYFIADNEIFYIHNNQALKLNIISAQKIQDFTINPKNPNIIYIGVGNVLYKTVDGGTTWETLQSPTKKPIREIKINSKEPNNILLSTIN